MRWLSLLLVVVSLMPGRGDGDWNDEDLPYTYSTNRVSGDLLSDQTLPIRLLDPTTGAVLMTTNTDPAQGDVGFVGLKRGIQTNVENGDFSQPPPDITQPISTGNPLPGWEWTDGGAGVLTMVGDTSYASGYRLAFDVTGGMGSVSYLDQLVPVPMSKGQQYRVLPSYYTEAAQPTVAYQYMAADKTTSVGSVITAYTLVGNEYRTDAGLVPTTAAYLRIRLTFIGSPGSPGAMGEVRVAFLPAEATLGLASLSVATGNIDSGTGETAVKSVTIPAGTFVVGSVYRITAWATVTSTAGNVVTVRVRIGPTTLTGAIVESINPTATATATNEGVRFDAMVTVRSVGATGTVTGAISFVGSASEPFTNPTRTDVDTGTVTIDTTVANLLELTAVTAAGTTDINFRQAVIECVMAS